MTNEAKIHLDMQGYTENIMSDDSSMDIKYKGENYSFSIGDRIQRLTIIGLCRIRINSVSRKCCVCKCDCGNVIGPSRLHMLINGELVSCGCYSRDIHRQQMINKNTIHGDNTRNNRTKLYNIWAGMLERTRSTNRRDSKYYSLKGIKVCNEWLDFENFKAWAIKNGYKEGLSIERKDNSIGYNPENCIFIQLKDQNKNKTNSRIIEYNGIRHTITEWCRITGLSWSRINNRLNKGMSVGKALGFEK